MPSIPIITTRGYKSAIRYLITEINGRFWTGKNWTQDSRQAVLYLRHTDAIGECHKIVSREHRGCPVYQNFRVPLQLEVFSPTEVAHDEVRDYTRKALKLNVLYADHGLGPIEGSAVLPAIRWGEMYLDTTSEKDHE